MFELDSLFWVFSWVFLSLSLFNNPVSMIGLIILMSLILVWTISVFSSVWFSYILFLVYVGGLLVLFIYVCLVSSNFPLKFSMSLFTMLFFVAVVSSEDGGFKSMVSDCFLGPSLWMSGKDLLESESISLFLFLAVLLLGMLLVAVRISGGGSLIQSNNEKF